MQGTVTDQSPGALGTPAIADSDQEAWMEYLYMQQPMPFNVTGVPVSLDAYDPNGNLVHIGTATSDGSGHFSYIFTPQVPGKYTIVASFAGSDSYGSSAAETALVVAQSPTATSGPTATPTSVADMYFVPAIAALFVLIIVVAIVLALLMLRKKP